MTFSELKNGGDGKVKMKSGFTLLEVIVALLLVSILATGLLPALTSLAKASLNSELVYATPSIAQTTLAEGEKPKNVYTEKFGVAVSSASTTLGGMSVSTATVKAGEYVYAIASLNASAALKPPDSEPKNKDVFATPLNASATTQTTTVQISTSAKTLFTPFPREYCKTCSIWGIFYGIRPDANKILIESWLPITRSGFLDAWVTFRTSTPNVVILDMPSAFLTGGKIHFVYMPVDGQSSTPTKPVLDTKCGDRWPVEVNTKSCFNIFGGCRFYLQARGPSDMYDWAIYVTGGQFFSDSGEIEIYGSTGTVNATQEISETVYKPAVTSTTIKAPANLLRWESITFNIGENTTATVAISQQGVPTYTFQFNGPMSNAEIPLSYLNLLPDKDLVVTFTVTPQNYWYEASVDKVKVKYSVRK